MVQYTDFKGHIFFCLVFFCLTAYCTIYAVINNSTGNRNAAVTFAVFGLLCGWHLKSEYGKQLELEELIKIAAEIRGYKHDRDSVAY